MRKIDVQASPPSDLSDILQHRHASQLLLDGAVVVNLAPELGSVGCKIHLTEKRNRTVTIAPDVTITTSNRRVRESQA